MPDLARFDSFIFDLGGTLLAIADDEIALDAEGRVTLLPGVAAALQPLHGRPLFVVTNQQSVALGLLSAEQAHGFVEQLDGALGGLVTDHRICMHLASAGCPCRKPRPGLVLDLARAHGLDLARALYVGDSESDQLCAQAAGVGTFRWAAAFFTAR